MTREEAIKMAKADLKCMERDTSGQDEMCNSHKCDECSLNYERGNMGEQKEWLRMAIQALEQESSVSENPNNCDLISRGEVLEMAYDMSEIDEEHFTEPHMVVDVADIQKLKPQERTGHWEWIQYDSNPNIGNWHCSECRTIIPHMPEETDNTPIYKWCPMCGAKMVEPQERSDKG